jgi:purine-binding chemotaxis protein CheW
MGKLRQLVVFNLDEQQYGLNLSCVERIVRAVEITRLPDSSANILGVINVEGRITPVVNARKRLDLPERDIELSDHFIIVEGAGQHFAISADSVEPVTEIPEELVVRNEAVLAAPSSIVWGVAKLEQGIIVILDADKTVPLHEQEHIRQSMREVQAAHHV